MSPAPRSARAPRAADPRAERCALIESARARIAALDLDLSGMRVLAEAATGAYASTAVIAAMAGARVEAVAREGRGGGAAEAVSETGALAELGGVADRIAFAPAPSPNWLAQCDIVANAGRLRPISRAMIEAMPRRAVIALMYEAWEFRPSDIDLPACRDRGIRVAAVNERRPDVGVFAFLGPLCVRLLEDAGARLDGARVAALCDNPFAPFLADGLTRAGASVEIVASPEALGPAARDWIVVALNPAATPRLGEAALAALAAAAPGARLAQFWGDVDRRAAARAGFGGVAPADEPAPGHMAILLNALGSEPIVRLQTGGLKAAELTFRDIPAEVGGLHELL